MRATRGDPVDDASHERWISVTRMSTDDAKLGARFASGDAESVRAVYQAHKNLVFAISYKILGDRGLAEDATQQTFVQAWRGASGYDPNRSLTAWLSTIAKRVAIDIYRRERRHRGARNIDTMIEPSLVTLPPSDEQISDVAEVRQALDKLPTQDRDLLRMQHFDELTHSEMADELEIPLGTVKSRTFRAHRRLAEIITNQRTQVANRPTDRSEGGTHGRR